MKRLHSSDSLRNLMFSFSTSDEQSARNHHMYSGDFQSMLDGLNDDESLEESGNVYEKKRRLSVEQVKALEKNFEVENKLEPERKVKLAIELGLQPRQVAVWFQNRRARWKTKNLERDFGTLKTKYDSLKADYDALNLHKESLVEEIREIKAKLEGEDAESNMPLKEETIKVINLTETPSGDNGVIELGISIFPDFKTRSSDSDSSAVFNEENSSNAAISPPAINCFHYVKMEEHNFFTGEETCNFFSDEQAPTLHWYSSDQWN